MTHLLEDFQEFLTASPTSYHAVREMGDRLAFRDFTPLHLNEPWKLEKGKKYFVIRDGSIAAFVCPKNKPEHLPIIAAHTDSPALKLKPIPDINKKNMKFLGVEVYGGPILASWFNRDLELAGKVIISKKDGVIEEHLVLFDDAPLIIPLIAPHLEREAFKKGLEMNKQEHLVPLAGLGEKLEERLIESLTHRHITFDKLLDFDLFLVPMESPRYIGANGEMIAAYRLDNLSSTHAALVALGHIEKAPNNTLPMAFFWDHEEIGSSTEMGAQSPFFQDVYNRITTFYKMSSEEESILRAQALCLSVDMTHAYNPNYEKKYDPKHTPLLGEGIVIKYNANKRYATSARGSASVIHLADKLGLKWQQFANRTDNPPGSTVGPLFATKLGIETVDIGIAQLSMHAIREVIAGQDQIDLSTLLAHFLQE